MLLQEDHSNEDLEEERDIASEDEVKVHDHGADNADTCTLMGKHAMLNQNVRRGPDNIITHLPCVKWNPRACKIAIVGINC